MDDLGGIVNTAVNLLWVALFVAIAVFVGALVSTVAGPIMEWAEPIVAPWIARRTRALHGVAPEAPRWACGRCQSVNEPTAVTCYRCGAPSAEAAATLPESSDEIYVAPPPVDRFDPSLYRGPGAPARPTSERGAPGTLSAPTAEPDAPADPGAARGPTPQARLPVVPDTAPMTSHSRQPRSRRAKAPASTADAFEAPADFPTAETPAHMPAAPAVEVGGQQVGASTGVGSATPAASAPATPPDAPPDAGPIQ